MSKPTIFFIMGVAGTGKSSIGKAAAQAIGIPFIEGDDYHPSENISKMSAGIPLRDEDRWCWLARLNQLAQEHINNHKSVIISCSALKQSYRDLLCKDIQDQSCFLVLDAAMDVILERIKARDHFFSGEKMLQDQFRILEQPIANRRVKLFDVEDGFDQVLERCISTIKDQTG